MFVCIWVYLRVGGCERERYSRGTCYWGYGSLAKVRMSGLDPGRHTSRWEGGGFRVTPKVAIICLTVAAVAVFALNVNIADSIGGGSSAQKSLKDLEQELERCVSCSSVTHFLGEASWLAPLP